MIPCLICTLRIDLKGSLCCKMYPVKYTLQNLPIFFQAGTLKKVGCHTYESEINQASTLKKSR